MIGFVQAGGGSTRFGTDKALARLGGESLLERTAKLVGMICDSVCVVAQEGKYPNLAPAILADRYPGEGPLGGIIAALETMASKSDGPSAWALIVGCDMPFLTAEFLKFLCDQAKNSSAQVIVPQCAGRLEPLCAAWHSTALSAIQAAFDSGVRKVTEAMKQLRMEVLDERVWKRFDTENRLFWNMNTREDFEEARRILEGPRVH